MTRQLIIRINGMDHMLDAQIDRIPGATVYNITGSEILQQDFGKGFEVVVSDEHDEPLFRPQSNSEEGQVIMQKVWEQLQALPPQLKGGHETGKP